MREDGRAAFEGLYRASLAALPKRFRERHWSELLSVFRRRTREARKEGRGAAAVAAAREIADALATGARLRMGAWGRRGPAGRRRGQPSGGRSRPGHPGRHEREEAGMGIDGWRQDLKLAIRTTERSPLFTAAAVGTLGLGVGAAVALFSLVHGVLLAPLPFAEPDRLVFVWQNDRATGTVREPASAADYFDFRERSRSFAGLAMFGNPTANLILPDGTPRRVQAAAVSTNLLDILGVEPVLGRGFRPEEGGRDGSAVALISERLHREVFGGNPDVAGRSLSVDGTPYAIVGVLPEGLRFPRRDTDLWVPVPVSPATARRNPHSLTIVGRLAPGVRLRSARREMNRIAADLEAEFPANANRGAFVEPVPEFLRGDLRLTLWVVFAGTGLLLLVACANVANLLLARATARRREVAVHAALGAGRGRIARRFLLEGVILALGAGAVGTALAVSGLRVLQGLTPPELVALGDARLSGPVLAFAVGVVALVGIVFGLIPALAARSLDLRAHLGASRGAVSGSSRQLRLRDLLVAGQVAVAAVLLVGAALLGRTLWNLQRVDPGFTADNVLRVSFTLPPTRYPRDFSVYPDWPEVHEFHRELLRRVGEVPGVLSVAVALNDPLDPGFTNSFSVEGRPPDPEAGEMTTRLVSPGYFETVGLELVEGRLIRPTDDREARPVILLNRSAVRRHFPGGDALGQRISFWGTGYREVVGVVEDERMHGLTAEAPPAMYVSLFQAPPRAAPELLLVRTRDEPTAVLGPVREIVASLDPELALYDPGTLDETVERALARERFMTVLLGAFGTVALILATLGVHGTLAYSVARRRGEVSLRMALGATAGDVIRLVTRQGLTVAGVGLVGGLAVAWAGSSVLSDLLFRVEPTDPWTFAAVGIGLALVALAAAVLPAASAARTPPASSLKTE